MIFYLLAQPKFSLVEILSDTLIYLQHHPMQSKFESKFETVGRKSQKMTHLWSDNTGFSWLYIFKSINSSYPVETRFVRNGASAMRT